MCSFYIYTSQYLREFFPIRYCLFSLGKHLGQQITHLTSIATYSLNYTKCAVRVQVLCCAFTEKRALDLQTIIRYKLKMIQKLLKTLNIFFFFQNGELGLLLEEMRTLLYFGYFFPFNLYRAGFMGEGGGGRSTPYGK